MAMYDLIKTLAAQFIAPLPMVFALLALAALWYWRGWRRLSGCTVGLAAVLLWLMSWPPVVERLLLPLESAYPPLLTLDESRGELAPPDAVVVLGSGWRPQQPWSDTARLGEGSALRLMEGIRLWRQRPELTLAVTGASRRAGEQPVARGYASAAESLGVSRDRLLVLDTPTDTGLEARAVRDALGEGARIVLVTSASHMPRAVAHFRAAGLNPLAAPTHYLAGRVDPGQLSYWVPSSADLRKTERVLYEWMGRLAVQLEQ
ncbi:MAG: ElyC/SanA/YdcF family protein [Pseudohongiellaceae bacterium]